MLLSKRVKQVIESRSGLALSDALNVAMFLLTVPSLIVAIISVAIAVRAYRSADEGAREQAAILKSQADTLMAANQTLANLLDQSKGQLSASRDQLIASKKLVDEMNRGLVTSKDQLDLARRDIEHRREVENRHPVVEGQIACSDVDQPPLGSYVPMFLGGASMPDNFSPGARGVGVSNLPTVHLKKTRKKPADGYQTYTCAILLQNVGDAAVEDGFMHVSWGKEEPLGGLSHLTGARVRNYDDFIFDAPWHRRGLVVFDKAKLFTLQMYGRPNAYRFELQLPDELTSLQLNYHVVGSNFARVDGSVTVEQGD